MPRNPEAFADMVVLTVKAALGPLLERIAAAEQSNRELQARLAEFANVRDRLTVVETKAAQPLTVPDVDLAPVYERVAGIEARVASLGDLRDRVVTIETKSVAPVAPIQEATSGPSTADLELSMRDKLEPLAKEVSTLRERLAVLEVRQPIPGPPGPKGEDGLNGKDGKDGMDGLGYNDLVAVQDDDRSFTVKAIRGDVSRDIGKARFPVLIQRGVYVEGKSYEQGDVVTWGGSQWHANEDTTLKPGEGSKAWTLVVKRGRDGRDGKDAPTVPVVKV